MVFKINIKDVGEEEKKPKKEKLKKLKKVEKTVSVKVASKNVKPWENKAKVQKPVLTDERKTKVVEEPSKIKSNSGPCFFTITYSFNY